MKTKAEAMKRAKALVKKLGPGWKLHVHKSMEWHFNAEQLGGHVQVHERFGLNGKLVYYCIISSGDHAPTGRPDWVSEETFSTPRKAVEHTVSLMRTYIRSQMEWLRTVEVVTQFPIPAKQRIKVHEPRERGFIMPAYHDQENIV